MATAIMQESDTKIDNLTKVPSVDEVISIDKVVSGDAEALLTLKQCMIARGWCKIEFCNEMFEKIENALDSVHKWLIENDYNYKIQFSRDKEENKDEKDGKEESGNHNNNNNKLETRDKKEKNKKLEKNNGNENASNNNENDTKTENSKDAQSDYGYNCIKGYKEGLRVLTSDIFNIHEKNMKYPSKSKSSESNDNNHTNEESRSVNLSKTINDFNDLMDDLSIKIMKSIAEPIYDLNNYKEFGTIYDVSLLNTINNDDKMKRIKQPFNYAMLDFVNYFNNKQFITKIRNENNNNNNNDTNNENKENNENNDMSPKVLLSQFNVFEHCDPGLFALSFLSDNDIGLQLYDPIDNKWININKKQSIWWNGMTSYNIGKNNQIDIKAAKHRVMIDETNYKSRFTAWYEICINAQLRQNILNETITFAETSKDERTIKLLNEWKERRMDHPKYTIDPKSKLGELLKGIPASKSPSMEITIPIRQKNSNNNGCLVM